MRTCASSAPGTPGSPRRAGSSKRASRSSCSRRATASAAGSGRSSSPTARRSTAAARGSAPKHDAIFGLARGDRRVDLQDVGEGRAPPRRRRPHPPLHRPHPEDQPARRRHDRAGAVEARSAWPSRSRSTRRGRRSAPRSGTRARSPGGSSAPGSAPTSRATCSRWRCAACSPATCNDVSFLHLLFLVRGARQHQHAVLDRERRAGEHGRRRRRLDRAARRRRARRRGAPRARRCARSRNATIASSSSADDLVVSARHAVVAVPPALALEIEFDPVLPDDRLDAVPQRRSRGPETKTLVVYDEPFWRADGFSGQTAEPGLGGRGDARRVARRRARPGVHRVVHVRAGRRARSTRSIPPSGARAVLDALDGPARPARGVARRVHRDRVVERGVDARLLDGAPPPGHPHALRPAAPRAVRPRALGRHRDGDDVARRDRRRRPLRRTRRGRDPRPHVAPSKRGRSDHQRSRLRALHVSRRRLRRRRGRIRRRRGRRWRRHRCRRRSRRARGHDDGARAGPTSAGRGPTDRPTTAPRHHRREQVALEARRWGGVIAAAGDDDGATAVVEERGGERRDEDTRRVRRGHRAGPAGRLGAGVGVFGHARLAPRHPAHLFGGSATALHDGGRDRVVARTSLAHAASARSARSCAAWSPPQNPSWRPSRGNDLVGDESHQRERAGGGVEPGFRERGEILFARVSPSTADARRAAPG